MMTVIAIVHTVDLMSVEQHELTHTQPTWAVSSPVGCCRPHSPLLLPVLMQPDN